MLYKLISLFQLKTNKMDKIKNWLLTALLAIGGVLDFTLELTKQFGELLSIPESYVKYIQLGIAISGFIILKLQPPTKKSSKLKVIANKMAAAEDEIIGTTPK